MMFDVFFNNIVRKYQKYIFFHLYKVWLEYEIETVAMLEL